MSVPGCGCAECALDDAGVELQRAFAAGNSRAALRRLVCAAVVFQACLRAAVEEAVENAATGARRRDATGAWLH
jgi:hypothetical protein